MTTRALTTQTRFNRAAIDAWTPVHVASGFALGRVGFSRPAAYGLIAGVEAIELLLAPSTGFFQESRRNIIADLLIGAGAYELGRTAAGPRP